MFNYASPSFGACLAGPDILLSLAQDNKKMQKIIVPKEKPKKVGYFGGVASQTDVCFFLAIVSENLPMLCDLHTLLQAPSPSQRRGSDRVWQKI